MRLFAIELSYEGTDFCGWQSQKGSNPRPSVEDVLSKAIQAFVNESPTIVASGRTDAGVHASGQVAHFGLQNLEVTDSNMLRGLNNLLPDSIQIHKLWYGSG